MSLQQLREAAEGHHPGPVLGLYVGTLRYGIEIDDTIRQLAPDRFCATPKYVSLTGQLDRAIHIPREFVDDPCLAALAPDHEAKHAVADATAFDHARSLLSSAIRAPPSALTRSQRAIQAFTLWPCSPRGSKLRLIRYLMTWQQSVVAWMPLLTARAN